MATSSKIHLSASQRPEYFVAGLSQESADAASELLQENHEKYHIFFNHDGFHVSFSAYLMDILF
jgi:UDP-N-acetyl-D-mannosaminuronic acid transferase (WecB/TagA/CpsF family)